MTNDIVKIKSVAASQGGETEHGLMLDSSILSYTYQGSSKTVKWILDTIFTLLGGKADSSAISTINTALSAKAPLSNPDFTGRVYCASGHFDEVYGDDDNGLDIKPSVDSIYGISLTDDGGITIDGEVVEGEAVDTTPTANSQRLITSGAVATALSGKADSDHAHTSIEAGEVDITCQQTTSGGKVVITIGDDNIQLIGADLVKLRELLDA